MSTDILTAFLTRLESFNWTPALPVMWPGVKGDPPNTGQWLEASLFPGEPTNLAWNADSASEFIGFAQIMVGYRPGTGEVLPSQIADAIIAHFPKSLELGGVRIRKAPYRSPSFVEDGNKLFIPVTIPYRGIV